MATVVQLDQQGALFKLDVLEQHVQEFRQFYASPVLYEWITGTLPGMASAAGVELTPQEQIVALLELFCAGERLAYEFQFKPLAHITDGVWELKTTDIRIFGWFSRKDCFIGAVADDATRIKAYKLYHGYANVTTRGIRDTLNLDQPKFVPGDDPHAVVSNFNYP
jgi:hypothetical protein